MNRSYKIKPIHATMRLDRWIKNTIGKYPQSLLEKSIRKGNEHIIKSNAPLVVPIKISGFSKVFQRNGLKVIDRKKEFSIEIMKPLRKDIIHRSIEEITLELEQIIN